MGSKTKRTEIHPDLAVQKIVLGKPVELIKRISEESYTYLELLDSLSEEAQELAQSYGNLRTGLEIIVDAVVEHEAIPDLLRVLNIWYPKPWSVKKQLALDIKLRMYQVNSQE